MSVMCLESKTLNEIIPLKRIRFSASEDWHGDESHHYHFLFGAFYTSY